VLETEVRICLLKNRIRRYKRVIIEHQFKIKKLEDLLTHMDRRLKD